MNFRPTDDRILVNVDPIETKTSSGIFLHVEAAEAVNRGTVLAVGPGRYLKSYDKHIPVEINVNERVLFAPGSGLKVRVEGVDYLVLKEDEVIAIVEEE